MDGNHLVFLNVYIVYRVCGGDGVKLRARVYVCRVCWWLILGEKGFSFFLFFASADM